MHEAPLLVRYNICADALCVQQSMFSTLGAREKLTLLAPPNFQSRRFRIEWQTYSLSGLPKPNSFVFSTCKNLRPNARIICTCKRKNLNPPEINTYRKITWAETRSEPLRVISSFGSGSER